MTWLGFPWWLSGKEFACQSRRCTGFDPWAWKIIWRRKWQPTAVFLPEKAHRQKSLAGYSPWGRRVRCDCMTNYRCTCCAVLGSSVISDSLRPHGLQLARLPRPSPSHPAISSSVVLFFSCFQSFPASGSFQMSQFFEAGGQSIGASASASVLPMSIQNWFPLGWTG